MIKRELNPENGLRLKECIGDIGMTQKELAERANCTPQFISNVIKGKRNMSFQTAEIFAKILRVNTDYLLGTSLIKNNKQLAENIIASRVARNYGLLDILSSFNISICETIVQIETPDGNIITDRINPPEHFLPMERLIEEDVEEIYNRIFTLMLPHENFDEIDIPEGSIISDIKLKINIADHEHEMENYKIVPYDVVFDLIVDILDFVDYKCDRLKETMNAEHFRRKVNY